MTRKDYIKIASVLLAGRQAATYDEDKANFLDHMIEAFAYTLQEENPRFDYHRFVTAAGHRAYQPQVESND